MSKQSDLIRAGQRRRRDDDRATLAPDALRRTGEGKQSSTDILACSDERMNTEKVLHLSLGCFSLRRHHRRRH